MSSHTAPAASTSVRTATERILVIDDEPNIRGTLEEFLQLCGFDVDTAENGSHGLDMLGRRAYDLVVSDVRMPDVDGIAVIEWMKETCPEIPVIVISGYATVESTLHAMRLGAHDYIVKPFTLDQIRRTIDNALERRRLARKNVELEERNEQLREIERIKDDLLSTVSHEFRTPLTAMKGFLSLVSHGDQTNLRPDQMHALDAIRANVDRLDNMIANLLTLTECQDGAYRPLLRPTALEIEDDAGEAPVMLDRMRFPLVLRNLLDNAFKFEREPGKAEVIVRARRIGAELLLEVHDDGIGVGETLGEELFDRFTQGDMTSTREHQGAGLGLAVVREIVGAHGGAVRLVPALLGGTSVRITLPVADPAGEE
jgi:signal transduction histidine kinase